MAYYIYHIEGVKIGVSNNPKERVKRQGFSNYEILEEHTCIYEVSVGVNKNYKENMDMK